MHRLLAALLLILALPAQAADLPLDRLTMPEGFRIETFARVPGARSVALSDGAVFVGSRGHAVHAVRLSDRKVTRVLDGLNVPNGIAVRDGFLYVAEQHRIVRYPLGATPGTVASTTPDVLFTGLPDKRWHGWRYAGFGPGGKLYVAVGAACNICRLKGLEGSIVRLNPEGGQPRIFAKGVRNSVGFDFHPVTGELHFTDNGADHMGDDSPPDELNHAPTKGLHFGFPFFGGGTDRTPDFRYASLPADTVPPEIAFGAHVAALGIDFYEGPQFPKTYRHDAFVAQHGSWNRSVPDGYRVVHVSFDEAGRATGYTPFIEGWLGPDGKAWGRPVDLEERPDGSLLVSDDKAGALYRVTYEGP